MGIFTRRGSEIGTKDIGLTPLDPRFADTIEREINEQKTEDGDHERFAHYVRKEKIVESAVTGKSVRALCGKKWVPSRDPEKFPICPTCKKIYDGLKKPEKSE